MKTKEQIIAEGYAEDWATQCVSCKSYNCHAYKDVIICFDCFQRVWLKNSESLFIQVYIDDAMIEEAKELAAKRRSFKRSNGCTPLFQTDEMDNEVTGIIGEFCFEKYLKGLDIPFTSTTRELFVGQDIGDVIVRGNSFDVKTSKTSVVPQLNHNASVNARQINSPITYLVFCSVNITTRTAYFTGFIPKDEFFSKASFVKQGQALGSTSICSADMFQIPHALLYSMIMLNKLCYRP